MRIAGASVRRAASLAIAAGFALLMLARGTPARAGSESAGQSLAGTANATTSTAEIPPAQPPVPPPQTTVDVATDPSQAAGASGDPTVDAATSQQIDAYDAAQGGSLAIPPPHLHTLQEFMTGGNDTSIIGVELREDRRKLSGGGQADGLLILKVYKASPAAEAGLHGYSTAGHSMLEGAALAAAMFFPPAVLAIPVLDETHIGESYDMIIGVDGKRVTNYLDFEDEMRDAKPGDVVYLSVVRNGKRLQISVHLPGAATTTTAAAKVSN